MYVSDKCAWPLRPVDGFDIFVCHLSKVYAILYNCACTPFIMLLVPYTLELGRLATGMGQLFRNTLHFCSTLLSAFTQHFVGV